MSSRYLLLTRPCVVRQNWNEQNDTRLLFLGCFVSPTNFTFTLFNTNIHWCLYITAADAMMTILERSMHGNGGYDGRLLAAGGDRRNKGKPFCPEFLAPRSHVHARVALRM